MPLGHATFWGEVGMGEARTKRRGPAGIEGDASSGASDLVADPMTSPHASPDGSWRDVVRAELTGGWPRWVSFACIWLWSCLVGKTGLSISVLAQLDGILAIPTGITLLANVAALTMIVFLSGALSTIVGSRGAMALAGILLTSGSVGIAISTFTGGVVAFVAGSCLGGAAIGFLKIAWGEMFSRMSLRTGLVDMGLSLVSSTGLFLGLLVLPAQVQGAVQIAALLACSLPCSWLAWLGTRRLGDAPTPPPPPGAAHAVTFSWTLLILPALVGLTFGLMSGVLDLSQPGDVLRARVGMAGSELLAGLVMLLASARLSPRFGASQIYAVGLVATVAGVALASVQIVPTWLAATVNELGFAVFYFFMVVYWGDLARRVNRPVVRTYALGYLVFQASQVPGMLVGTRLLVAQGEGASSGQTASALLFMAIVLAFFVAVLLVFNDPRSALRQWLAVGEPAETTDEIPEACAGLASRHSLTPREREVLSLLARGRTAAYIGRSLGIAPDTAKTHIRSIYRKMDIHTQQELIDLIEGRGAGDALAAGGDGGSARA